MHRVSLIGRHLEGDGNGTGGTPEQVTESLSVIDNRTGTSYEIPIKHNSIRATELSKIKNEENRGLYSYDPGYKNTACCTSKISYIDGGAGILRFRGYPIERLVDEPSFEEIAFLLIYGDLPTRPQLTKFSRLVAKHTYIPKELTDVIYQMPSTAPPMSMLAGCLGLLGSFQPASNPAYAGQLVYKDISMRNRQVVRVLGGMLGIATTIARRLNHLPPAKPNENLSFAENFLHMIDTRDESTYRSNPRLVRALEILFILHAEHELNCSTAAVRHLASSNVEVCTAISGAVGALYGPRHGGANEAVVRMLERIESVENVPQFLQKVKARKERLMGFGHRVYRSYDPRAKVVRQIAETVFEIVGREPLIDVAMALEKVALTDDYFIKRNLYPNVDFYSGLIYKALGFPTDFFPVLFAVPRCAGWLAHWYEFMDDPEDQIIRPHQIYAGIELREYKTIEGRQQVVPQHKLALAGLPSEKRVSFAGV